MSDMELITLVLNNNEEAALYLIYNRYEQDLRYYTLRYYNSLELLDDLSDELYLHLKGVNNDWSPLKSFSGGSSFRTWLCTVISHLFLKKRKELIDLSDDSTSIDSQEGQKSLHYNSKTVVDNSRMVILLEAINRLKNKDYQFVLLKEIEGYSAKEVAELLALKRREENKLKSRLTANGKDYIIPDAAYIHMIKSRAVKELKMIVEQIKEEWYGNRQ